MVLQAARAARRAISLRLAALSVVTFFADFLIDFDIRFLFSVLCALVHAQGGELNYSVSIAELENVSSLFLIFLY